MSLFRMLAVCVFTTVYFIPVYGDIYVAPDGKDDQPGTVQLPFRTLERARDEIRSMKEQGAYPTAGVAVIIMPGVYEVRQPFQLTAADSGTADGPVVYRAEPGAGAPHFNGGISLREFQQVTDPDRLARLPESARNAVREAALSEADRARILPLVLGGAGSGRGFKTHPVMELFVNGEPMTPARWPNEGFVKTGEATGPLTLTGWDNRAGSPEGRFLFDGTRPEGWVNEPDAWLYGYWYWDWSDSYEKIEKIDLDKREIALEKPWHGYGYRKDQRYYAVNILSELDAPGEWYLDRAQGRVYLYPKADLTGATVELSAASFPLVEVAGASHLRFQGLLWECGASDGVVIEDGEDCILEGCMIRKMAGNGVEIRGGHRHAVLSSDVHTLGRGGIVLAGGDRKTLEPGGHRVENCRVHHLSRIDHTYTPGVLANGVGSSIRNNCFHDIASSAMRVEGNEHLVEYNEIYRVVLESDDQGGADMWGNPTYRGNIYRYNYWHHLGNQDDKGEEARSMQAGIRLDDAICGTVIHGNVFHRCSTMPTIFGGVQIHGGKDNLVEGNLFADCAAAVSFSPWGEERWKKFVAAALDDPKIDRDLYLNRYPLLSTLGETWDVNTVRGNVLVRCDTLFMRAPATVESVDNREYPEGAEFPEGADGRLVWSAQDAEKLGVADIPFGAIGLYENEWRTRTEAGWVLRAFSQE